MAAINGFLVSADRAAIGIKTFRVPGTDVDLPVRTEVAALLVGLAKEFHERVEPLRKGECWGYAFRAVRGGSTPSFHAAGIAIDLNVSGNPFGREPTMDPRVIEVFERHGFGWGGRWLIPDGMHFEFLRFPSGN
jgi:hypothetical protein